MSTEASHVNLPTTLPDWLALLESRHPKSRSTWAWTACAQVKERLGIGFSCPVIIVGGTNGKGSTCAMLESILLRAGYRVGLYTSPHLLDFNERARIDGEIAASDAALVAAFDAVEAARGDSVADLFRIHHAGDAAAVRRCRAGRGDPGSRPGRPARRGQRDRCRRRHRHQRRHRPYRLSRRYARGDRLREGRHLPPRQGRHLQRSGAAAIADRPRRCDRRRPVAARRAISTMPATSSNGTTAAAASAAIRWLSGAARRQPAAERLGRAGRARSRCACGCRSAPRKCAPDW